jgi:predicted enzyme related to lactoylglutathione lyase
MALTSIEVMSVPVSDQDQAKTFYTEVLGFSCEIDSAFGDGMRWVMLRPPGGGSAITLVTWFDEMTAGWLRGTVLGCDDLDDTAAQLRGRGSKATASSREASRRPSGVGVPAVPAPQWCRRNQW